MERFKRLEVEQEVYLERRWENRRMGEKEQ